jgi:uncharacterized protein GlcG (DUF336 family)
MRLALMFALAALPFAGPAAADDILTVKQLSMELAADIAQRAVQQCRKAGYQVSAVVVDRSGAVQVVMRDALASRFTVEIAQKKANAVVLSGVASSTFRKNRADIRAEMNHVDGILMLEGGLPIRAAGALLGAVGVSGAPGGDKDEACAAAALAAVQERLEFAD